MFRWGAPVRPRLDEIRMYQIEQAAWGEERCTFCDVLVSKGGTLSCECPSKLVYRKEPAPPASAIRLYYIRGLHKKTWTGAVDAFESLSPDDRKHWDEQAATDRKRFEREKRAYNETLRLDEDIETDDEAEGECECGNGLDDIRIDLERRRCEQQWSRYRRDHPKFNASVITVDHMASPRTFHRFLDLPREIRDQVYRCLFQSPPRSGGFRQWQLEYETDGPGPELRFTHQQPLDTRILTANRQIYAESLDILYSNSSFVVDVARASTLPLFVQEPTGIMAPRPSAKIRRWHLQVTFFDCKHKQFILDQLAAVLDVMKRCDRLDEVRFTWFTVPHYWSEIGRLIEEYGLMLGSFRVLHNVGKVIFTDSFSDDGPCREQKWLDLNSNIGLPEEDVRKSIKASMEAP
ncbi:MAG: hypothetical protein Q9219_000834 [cf. Caloplaca sp. 3 TL-2023]